MHIEVARGHFRPKELAGNVGNDSVFLWMQKEKKATDFNAEILQNSFVYGYLSKDVEECQIAFKEAAWKRTWTLKCLKIPLNQEGNIRIRQFKYGFSFLKT